MSNNNSSQWMGAAAKRGLDVSFLFQDKLAIDNALDRLALPRPRNCIISPSELGSPMVAELFALADWFCRLVPRGERERRPYHSRLTSLGELKAFLSNYNVDNYTINLVERGPTTHTGAIIAQDNELGSPGRCFVEILRGQGPELFHGIITPMHIDVDETLRIIRFSSLTRITERLLVYRALKAIDGPQFPFPGYYEFEVWNASEIKFRNYQSPDSAYAKAFSYRMF